MYTLALNVVCINVVDVSITSYTNEVGHMLTHVMACNLFHFIFALLSHLNQFSSGCMQTAWYVKSYPLVVKSWDTSY